MYINLDYYENPYYKSSSLVSLLRSLSFPPAVLMIQKKNVLYGHLL